MDEIETARSLDLIYLDEECTTNGQMIIQLDEIAPFVSPHFIQMDV